MDENTAEQSPAEQEPQESPETPVETSQTQTPEEETTHTQTELPKKQELPKKLVNQPKYVGTPAPGRVDQLKAFITECKRVLRVTKKPDRQEFVTIVKISAIGIGIIGLIGFLVSLVKQLIFG